MLAVGRKTDPWTTIRKPISKGMWTLNYGIAEESKKQRGQLTITNKLYNLTVLKSVKRFIVLFDGVYTCSKYYTVFC